jgi:hypothetical protein
MSSDSLSSWLALRESADASARSDALTQAIVAALPRDRPLRILDLGSGTGSNLRYLCPRLPRPQQWLLVDRDPHLLTEVTGQSADCEIETLSRNLGSLDDPALFAGRHLVTASALLDLVSDTWLRTLADRCRMTRTAALFTLNYNGWSQCTPSEPEDDAIRDLMNRHQRTNDMGFGPAAGPEATEHATRSFAAAGYSVRREASDWLLMPSQVQLQRQLIQGWADAATEMAPEQTSMIRDWLARRVAHLEAGRSTIDVGHDGLAAWLDKSQVSSFKSQVQVSLET